MKKVILIGLLAAVPFGHGFAGTREELMARMGFSKEEIAKDKAAHNSLSGTLDATGGKRKATQKAAAATLREASEINKLRASRALREKAKNLAIEAEKRATLSKIMQQEAEAKAEVAVRETQKLIFNAGISVQTFGEALAGRDKFVNAAREAREVAEGRRSSGGANTSCRRFNHC